MKIDRSLFNRILTTHPSVKSAMVMPSRQVLSLRISDVQRPKFSQKVSPWVGLLSCSLGSQKKRE